MIEHNLHEDRVFASFVPGVSSKIVFDPEET